MLINVKMPTIVGILTLMSRINFVLSGVEHEKSFITSGPGFGVCLLQSLNNSSGHLSNTQRHRMTIENLILDGQVHTLFSENKTMSTDACLTADPGVRSHTFVEIDHEMISKVILLPSADSFKKGCCQLQAKVCARITG